MIDLDGFMSALQGAFSGAPGLAPLLVKYYLSVALVFWPVMRIVERFGRAACATLLLFVPLVGFVVVLVWLAVVTRPQKGVA